MNLPTPESPSEADDELVDLAEIETASGPEPSRSMLPAALAATAALLVWRFLGVGMLDENAAISDTVRIGLSILVATFVAAFPVWLVWRHGQQIFERRNSLLNVLVDGAIAVGVLFVVLGLNLLTGLVWQTVTDRPVGMPEQLEELAFSDNPMKLLLLGVMACVWAPVSEELFFRRMLFRALQGRMRLWSALLLQAVLFTIMHDYQGIHISAIFVLGLALGSVYAWRGSILPSMMLHCLQNTGATIVLGLLMWGSARAPVLGIVMENVEAGQGGVEVVSVFPGSGADEAGLQDGDVITGIRLGGVFDAPGMPEQPVTDSATLRILLMMQSAGDEVQLSVMRDGEPIDIAVTLQKRDDLAPVEDNSE